MLTEPLPNLDAWIAYFATAAIPVLRRTAQQLDGLRENPETLNAHDVAAPIADDPLMTLRVLAYISTHKARGQMTDIESVEGALMMMGATKFFSTFSDLPLVEDTLRWHPAAHLGLVRMIDDAHADHPCVRNVSCAINLARHSANGWDDPALPDDYRDIAQLLNVSPQHVEETVRPLEP